ncbi:MAG: proprotein convertase P-domain-containing protein [Ignavibacteria bacterium]|nr:proprotein convertase P-domain-containing protein [Ignavibacteria bacterium]
MDNVRLWRTARSASDIKDDRFIPFSMYIPSGKYASLGSSFLFNNDLYSGGGYSTGANGINITYINYFNKAVNFIDYNNNLLLNGTTDYCSHENHNGWFSMPGEFTLEAWIKRDTTGTQPLYQNIISKSGGTNVFDYGLYFDSQQGNLYFAINNYTRILQAPAAVQTAQWTHVAASYDPYDGKAVIYVNGDSAAGTNFSGNPAVQNNPYHIFFGATGASNNSANKFKGQLDDIKIWYKSERTAKEIKENMFCNKIRNMQTYDSVIYVTFDKYQSGVHVGGSSHVGGLKFFGNATVSSSHANTKNITSPVIHDPRGEFNSSSSVMSHKKFFVPDADINGITDSIYIPEGSPVNDLRACVMLSHSYTGDIDLILIAPSGSSVYLLEKNGFSGNDVMTIFSDAADSVPSKGINVNGPGINSPFSPLIKATQSLSVFNGQNRKGWWKLKIIDYASPDVGYMHGWGLNFKTQKKLSLSALIQGFYNITTNKMIGDTAKVLLRNALPPYAVVDSSKAVLDSNGSANFYFNKAENGMNYYAVLNHRNSIETWSSSAIQFNTGSAAFDFTTAASKAFGSNQINIDTSPLKFAVFGGDVNRDGNVDLTDVIQIHNSAANFDAGYIANDITGDKTVSLTDILLAYNNAAAFVSVRKP